MDTIRCRVLRAVRNGECCMSGIKKHIDGEDMPNITRRQISSALQKLKKEGRVKSWPWRYLSPETK